MKVGFHFEKKTLKIGLPKSLIAKVYQSQTERVSSFNLQRFFFHSFFFLCSFFHQFVVHSPIKPPSNKSNITLTYIALQYIVYSVSYWSSKPIKITRARAKQNKLQKKIKKKKQTTKLRTFFLSSCFESNDSYFFVLHFVIFLLQFI